MRVALQRFDFPAKWIVMRKHCAVDRDQSAPASLPHPTMGPDIILTPPSGKSQRMVSKCGAVHPQPRGICLQREFHGEPEVLGARRE